MKVPVEPRYPAGGDALVRQLTDMHRQIATQLNQLSEGQMVASYGARTAPPSSATESFQVGDFIRNSAPAELGTTPNKYVIFGWICTVAGSPGTWLQQRYLTGN